MDRSLAGMALCPMHFPLEDYAALVAAEAAKTGVTCVGVNINMWMDLRPFARKAPPKGVQHRALDNETLAHVSTVLARGAEAAANASTVAAAGITSTGAEPPVAFFVDVGRELGALGNAHQMSLAAASALFISEVLIDLLLFATLCQ
jgi:hypothetical protein